MTDEAQPDNPRKMRLIHCSDLHFGTEQPSLTDLLLAEIDRLKPDLVIVSGDFTQIGIAEEFKSAQKFLKDLKYPYFAIPGNHDISRVDMWERFTDPYRKYRRYITDNMRPVFRNDLVCIAGINTTRRIIPHWNWAHGTVSKWQLEWLREQYEVNPQAYRICVMHHPIWAVTAARLKTIVFGGRTALQAFKDMKIGLVLSGHVHHAAVETMPVDDKHKIIFLSASTALSRRLRGQKNGFNIVDLYPDRVKIEIRGYLGDRFDKLEAYEHLIN